MSCSTALRNIAGEADKKLQYVSAKGLSETRQWVGATTAMSHHKKLAEHYKKMSRAKVGRMAEYQPAVEKPFLDKGDKHQSYMKEIRATSEITMQDHKATLRDCMLSIEEMMEGGKEGKGKAGNKY